MRQSTLTRLLWLAAAAVAFYDLALALNRPDLFPDLDVYRVASGTLVEHGQGLYDVVGSNGGPFTYPPFAAIVLLPLRLPPMLVAGSLLTVLTAAATWATARVCATHQSPWVAPVACALALWTVPFRTTVFFGQLGAILLLLIVADLVIEAPPWPRGVFVGVAAAIKLTPLVFVVFLLVRRQRREAVTAFASFAAATAVGAALLPQESQRYWLHDLWHFGRVGELNGAHNRSLWGVLGSFGVPRPAVVVTVLAVLAFGVWRAARLDAAGGRLAAVTVMGLTSCLVSPITWSHHLVWLLPALVILLAMRQRAVAIAAVSVLVVANSRFSADPHLLTLVGTVAMVLVVLMLPPDARSHRHQPARVG